MSDAKYKIGDQVWALDYNFFGDGKDGPKEGLREITDRWKRVKDGMWYQLEKYRGPFQCLYHESELFPTLEELLESLKQKP